jgi:hypothetical protein
MFIIVRVVIWSSDFGNAVHEILQADNADTVGTHGF